MDRSSSTQIPKLLAGVAALGLCLVAAYEMRQEHGKRLGDPEIHFVTPASLSSEASDRSSLRTVVTEDVTPSVHSASAVEITGGKIRAFWFGGSREGAADVSIWSAVLDPSTETWSPASVAMDREAAALACGRHLRKLGNPVVSRAADGTLHLFTVAVSLGGWSGGRILQARSTDDGTTWSAPKKLVASPFFNISTLAKAPALALADGSLALPVYHEMIGKFPQLLKVSEQGELTDRINMLPGGEFIQPWIVPADGRRAQAYMRRWFHVAPPEIHRMETLDAGATWSAPAPVGLPNPNASVAALSLPSGELVIAYNHHEKNRTNLCLGLSTDGGKTFSKAYEVENKTREGDEVDEDRLEYSYPWLLADSQGDLHLLYTWNRKEIRHLRFSRALLEPSSPAQANER